MSFLPRLLELLFGIRGRLIPPGTHLAIDPAFSAFGWPEAPVKFRLALYSSEDEPLGSYLALADGHTACSIEGVPTTLDEVLGSIGEQHDHMTVVVEEAGMIASLDLNPRSAT